MNPRHPRDRTTEPEARIDEGAQQEPDSDASLATQDWDALANGELAPASVPENGDFRYEEDATREVPGEDDDNAYQESDEALPADEEEAAIARDPSKEGGRFDEI